MFLFRALQNFEDGDFESVNEYLEAGGSLRGNAPWSPNAVVEAAEENYLRGVAVFDTKPDAYDRNFFFLFLQIC